MPIIRITFLCIAGSAIAVALYFKGHSTSPPPISDGDYAVRNISSKLVLDDPYSSKVSGEHIIEWDWNRGLNQQWHFVHSGSGYYTIQNRKSGLFLTDPGGPRDKEVPLQQQTAKNDDSQLWYLTPSGKFFTIRNKASNFVIRDGPSGSIVGSAAVLSQPGKGDDRKGTWEVSRST